MKMVAPLEVGICCKDLDRLAEFYVQVLGFRLVNVVAVPADKARQAALADVGYRVARLQTPYGERVKLLEAESGTAETPRDTWLLDRTNAAYLTFIVDDLDAMIAALRKAGVEPMTGPAKVEVRPQTYLSFCRDPEGNVLEFVQYGDIAAYRPDLAATQAR